jgi:hypothetical protein
MPRPNLDHRINLRVLQMPIPNRQGLDDTRATLQGRIQVRVQRQRLKAHYPGSALYALLRLPASWTLTNNARHHLL